MVHDVIDDEDGGAGQIQIGLFRILGQPGFRMQQGQVIRIAFHLQMHE